MGRYDAYDDGYGFGDNSLMIDNTRHRSRSQSMGRLESRNDRERSRSQGRSSTPQRGRSLTRDNRSLAQSRGESSATRTVLRMKSISRAESRRGRSRSATPDMRRSRSKSRSARDEGVEYGYDDFMDDDSSYFRKSRSRSRSNKKKIMDDASNNWSDGERSLADSDDDEHDRYGVSQKRRGDATVGAETSKFTNVTIQPFLPTLGTLGTSGGPPGDVNGLGSCLFNDLKDITKWPVGFTVSQMLTGLSVAMTQVPECISYAYIAGMDPLHALQAAWIANVLSPIVGGRPGLICGSSGLGAIAIRYCVMNYGQEYVCYAVVLSGLCQVLFGALRIGKYLRLLPPGITIGMVNALCLLLVALQLRYFKEFPSGDMADDTDATEEVTSMMGMSSTMETSTENELTRHLESTSDTYSEDNFNQPWAYYYGFDLPWSVSPSHAIVMSVEALVAIVICFYMPRFIQLVPSSLVAILVLTVSNWAIQKSTDWDAPTVGDYCISELPTNRFWQGIFHSSYTLPSLFEWKTLMAVAPTGLSLSMISLLETMVAINVSDKYTGTDSEQDRVFYGQGVANLASGLMGGMVGSGSAHSSLHGLRVGGVTSTSVFFAGIYMLMAIVFAYPAVAMIPLGATLGVTLYLFLVMIQWAPMVALVLKCVPSSCLVGKPHLLKMRLATPDLFSTFATSIFALCASTYALAGYVAGVFCYVCDPIGHAIISGDNENGYSFIDLKLSKPIPTKGLNLGLRERFRKRGGGRKNSRRNAKSRRHYTDSTHCDDSSAEDSEDTRNCLADIENQCLNLRR